MMNYNQNKMKYQLTLLFVFILFSCNSDKKVNESNKTGDSQTVSIKEKQLNITILLDLSDRIDPRTNPVKPEHFQRDTAIVKYFTRIFVNDMKKKGTYMSRGKMKVIFSPKPQDPNINLFAEKLSVDLTGMKNPEKKEVYDKMTTNFSESLDKIYGSTISESKWTGSDIWRFFKNDVKDYCVERDSNYRNILVILTDGYIYHKDSKDQVGNRYAYLLPSNIMKIGLRKPNWEKILEKSDFGLITKRNDLQNLEVLVLEVSPSSDHKDDEDVIKAVLAKWFVEMNVKRFGIFNSDLPEYTKQRINDFIK